MELFNTWSRTVAALLSLRGSSTFTTLVSHFTKMLFKQEKGDIRGWLRNQFDALFAETSKSLA